MDNPSNLEPPPSFTCPHCQTGTLHQQKVVFAHLFEDHFITIPNFPGWVCDICGTREYDSAALEQLELILGPEADLRRATNRRTRLGRSQAKPHLRPTGRRRI